MKKLMEYFENTGVQKQFFARKIGTNPTTLSSWLKGTTTPKIRFAIKIEEETKGFVKIKDWLVKEPRKSKTNTPNSDGDVQDTSN